MKWPGATEEDRNAETTGDTEWLSVQSLQIKALALSNVMFGKQIRFSFDLAFSSYDCCRILVGDVSSTQVWKGRQLV